MEEKGGKTILITREMDYAVRIVRTLHRNGQQSAAEIAEKEGIPMPFAYKILKKLSQSGILTIFRGPSGGYQLLRPCDAMTLLDLVKALGEDVMITECMEDGYHCTSGEGAGCGVHREFNRIQRRLEEELAAKKISEIFN